MKTAESIFRNSKELDAIIILSEKNRLYYTGFHSTFGILLFLKNGETQWSMTPFSFAGSSAFGFILLSDMLTNDHVISSRVVRPSISLKSGIYVSVGDGTVAKPYVVE